MCKNKSDVHIIKKTANKNIFAIVSLSKKLKYRVTRSDAK